MKSKKFLNLKALAEKSTGKKLRVLRTDNGSEYTSAEFENYPMEQGVKHQPTLPKTPEQNGVAENMNRTSVEPIRSMLADTKLPRKLWAETLWTAVYLRNRNHTTAVKWKTSFEAWMGQKPNLKDLHVFGSEAFAYVPKNERQKLYTKARKYILFGHGT